MRIVIIANGWLNSRIEIRPADIVLAADGGARHAIEQGITPAKVIGDLDSLNEGFIKYLGEQGVEISSFPRQKDHTDLELAIQEAIKLGANEIIIHGIFGGRWDQTIANVMLLVSVTGVPIRLVDGNQQIQLLRGSQELELQGQPGDIVSLIPLSSHANGITTQNLEYPLRDETLYLGTTRGVSNVMVNNQAKVCLKEGLLLCTLIHNPTNSEIVP